MLICNCRSDEEDIVIALKDYVTRERQRDDSKWTDDLEQLIAKNAYPSLFPVVLQSLQKY